MFGLIGTEKRLGKAGEGFIKESPIKLVPFL